MRESTITACIVATLVLAGCTGADDDAGDDGVARPGDDDAGIAPAGWELVEWVDGFEKPVHLTHAGDGSGRVFVVEQAGRVLIIKDGVRVETPFLDIRDLVGDEASEQGLLSIAFHPQHETNGFVYVDYTNNDGDSVVARYKVMANDPDRVDKASARTLLTVDQPFVNHNGGLVEFGPDGYLYIGFGDGGAAADPLNHGQNKGTLLGTILRIDVDSGNPYGVPPDNPFVGDATARPEIWAWGLRNPWRFSFDRDAGDLWIADVGQNAIEEINFQKGSSKGGENYGWAAYEGTQPFRPGGTVGPHVPPVAQYDHNDGCSVTGGFVYRGPSARALEGVYLFGDYCTATLWGLTPDRAGWQMTELRGDTGIRFSSFGEDEAGEVYAVDHQGAIWKFVGK